MVLLVKNLVRQISNFFFLLYSSVVPLSNCFTYGEFANDRLPRDSQVGDQIDATYVCLSAKWLESITCQVITEQNDISYENHYTLYVRRIFPASVCSARATIMSKSELFFYTGPYDVNLLAIYANFVTINL